MEAVVFVGLQGAGKSTFFAERFFATHVRVSLDVLKTRHRERRFIDVCLETRQPFVIDNTNPARADRAGYVKAANSAGFAVVAYYFRSRAEDCLRRNAQRDDAARVPDIAILSTAKRLELPSLDEGFERLHYVQIKENTFVVEPWRDEV